MDLEKLEHDLRAARKVAHNAAYGVIDNGTCNLDSVIVPTGSNYLIKRVSKTLDKIFGMFGGTRINLGSRGRGYMLSYPQGQAAKRTVAAEAAVAKLVTWDAYVHYQMD